MKYVYCLTIAIFALLIGTPNVEADELGSNLGLAGSFDTAGSSTSIAISGNYAYVADGGNGLVIFKKTSPVEEIIIIISSAACFSYLYWRYSPLTIKYKIPEAKHKLKTQIARLKEKGIETGEFEEIIKKLEN